MTYDLLIKYGTVVHGTGVPRRHADYFGFKDHGRLTPSAAADVVLFDANTIGSPERASLVRDLPAGGARMVAKAQGISHVVVNGAELYRDGQHTGAFPGRVLRIQQA